MAKEPLVCWWITPPVCRCIIIVPFTWIIRYRDYSENHAHDCNETNNTTTNDNSTLQAVYAGNLFTYTRWSSTLFQTDWNHTFTTQVKERVKSLSLSLSLSLSHFFPKSIHTELLRSNLLSRCSLLVRQGSVSGVCMYAWFIYVNCSIIENRNAKDDLIECVQKFL